MYLPIPKSYGSSSSKVSRWKFFPPSLGRWCDACLKISITILSRTQISHFSNAFFRNRRKWYGGHKITKDDNALTHLSTARPSLQVVGIRHHIGTRYILY